MNNPNLEEKLVSKHVGFAEQSSDTESYDRQSRPISRSMLTRSILKRPGENSRMSTIGKTRSISFRENVQVNEVENWKKYNTNHQEGCEKCLDDFCSLI